MTRNSAEVSAFEAKTRLSELLRETERGKSFLIRWRGKAVARLVPPGEDDQRIDVKSIVAGFREVRMRIPGTFRIRELIEEGRRY